MRTVQIAICLLLTLPLAVPAGSGYGPTATTDPAQATQPKAGMSAAGDPTRVYGDVWTVCLSKTGGCSVTDASGTFDEDCDQYPIKDPMWAYVTTPAVLEVQADGDANGIWEAHTLGTTGTFTQATATGTSCIVIDDPNIVVVRTNGIVEYEL